MGVKKIEQQYLTVAEVAKILGKSQRTVERWVFTEKLEAHSLFGRNLIEVEYFERWKKRNIIKKTRV